MARYVLDRYVQEYTLQASDITSLVTSPTNVDYVQFSRSVLSGSNLGTDTSATIGNSLYISNYIVYNGTTYDDISNVNTFSLRISSSNVTLIVANGTYASLAEAQADLAGTKIYYQLATPLIANETIDVDGTLIQDTTTTLEQLQSLTTKYNMEFSINTEQTVKTLVDRDKIQQREIDSLEDRVGTLETITQPAEDDLRFPATLLKQGATVKPDFDYTNVGLLFPQNDTAEIIYIVAQMPHNRQEDSAIEPHVHCRLSGAGQPVFKMDYKWYNPSEEAIPSTWTTYTMNVNTATWTSGTISNMIYGASPIDGTGKGASSILLIKLYRDDNVYVGDLLVDEFDIHYTVDKFGDGTVL